MEYVNIYPVEELKKEFAEKEAAFKANTGLSDFVGFAVNNIYDKIAGNPAKYLEYGVYWPSLNKLLAKHGKEISSHNDKEIDDIYSQESDGLLIIAAERMADWNRKNLLKGTRVFDLSADGDLVYNLYDQDLELLIQVIK